MKALKNVAVGMMCFMMLPASIFSEVRTNTAENTTKDKLLEIVINDYTGVEESKVTIKSLKSNLTFAANGIMSGEKESSIEYESLEYCDRVLENTFLNASKENKEETLETEEENKTEKKVTKKKSKKNKSKKRKLIDNFKITAYCIYGHTASGTITTANRTIAADPSVLPYGTKVVINGQTYVVEDTGGAIKGNRIDIYMSTYNEAINWGVRYVDVYYAD